MKNIKYTDAPVSVERALERGEPVTDFLPTPDRLIRRQSKQKITIAIDSDALARYKAYAEENGGHYQTLIDNVLGSYAKHYL